MAHRLGNAPRNNAANLTRGLALCAAVAATLFGPTVLAGHSALDADVMRLVVTLFTIGAALLALRGRLVAPRSLRAWLLWALGSVVLGAVGAVSLGSAVIYLLIEQGARIAVAATFAWAGAVLLNAFEARRAFRTARVLCALRLALYGLSATLLVALSALRVADLALPALQRALVATAAESLAPGLATAAGVLFAIVIGLAAWRVPYALAQRQFDGRLAASAAGETLWFCSLATWLMPLAMPEVVFTDPMAALPAALWGEVALHVLSVVVAHGVVRVVMGGAGSIPPVPLIVMQRRAEPSIAARRLLERLPQAWGAGPVCRVMPPAAAAHEYGAHLQLAAMAGRETLLFPVALQDLPAWRDALPPWQHWRALATQELYAEPAQWRGVFDTWLTPQAWVLLLEDGTSRPPEDHGDDWVEALPDARSVRINLGVADDGYWPAALQHLPAWTDETGSADARAFAQWLRARVRPELPRRILLLHARPETSLANELAALLDGSADAQGRFVEAWSVGEHGGMDWRMPLGGFRLMAQVHLNQVQQRLDAGGGSAIERTGLQLSASLLSTLLGLRAQDAPAPYDVVLLHTQALRDAAGRWTLAPEAQPLIVSAARRLALRMDGGDATLCELDAQITTPVADPQALDATALRALAARLAEQILADAWVALAPAQAQAKAATPVDRRGGPDKPAAASAQTELTRARTAVAAQHRVLLVHETNDEVAHELWFRLVGILVERAEGRIDFELGAGRAELLTPQRLARYDAVVLLTTTSLVQALQGGGDLLDQMRKPYWPPVWRATLLPATLDPRIEALPNLSPKDDAGVDVPLLNGQDHDDHGDTLRLRADAVVLALRTALRKREAPGPAPADPPPPIGLLPSLRAPAWSLAVLSNGTLVAGLADGALAWQPVDAPDQPATVYTAHRGAVTALLPLAQGRLVSASETGTVLLWETLRLEALPRVLGQHEGAVRALAVSHEGDWVLSGGDDRTLRGWCLSEGVAPRSAGGYRAPIVAIDTDAERVFAACGEAGVSMLMAGSTAPAAVPTLARRAAYAVQVVGDNLYVAGHDTASLGFVQRLPLRQGGLPARELVGWPSAFTTMHVLADGRVVLGCRDGSLWLWSPSIGANAAQQIGRHESAVLALTMLADGRLCSACDSGRMLQFELPRDSASA